MATGKQLDLFVSEKTELTCKSLNLIMMVDPGFNGTGWAFWNGTAFPTTGRFSLKRDKVSDIVQRINKMSDEFNALIQIARDTWKVKKVIIEGTDFRPGSLKGSVAASSGAVVKLSYLVGSYVSVCRYNDVECEIIEASSWKGNLPKEVVGERIYRLNCTRYREHEEEAVGMGFGKLGIL